MQLKDKVAIVTGGASGMGAAEASILAANGAKVVITDIDAAAGRALSEKIGASALFFEHDASDEDGWTRVVRTATERFGDPTILVNNAGMPANLKIQDTDTALMRRVLDVNLMSMFFGIRAVLEPMKRAGGGSIINISSGLAMTSLPGFFPYGVSKWGVRGLTRLAAKDLAEFNIRVVTLFPGAIETPMLEPSVRANQEAMMPMKRVGSAEEFANVVLFLASDAASYVSGAEIMIDGALIC
jgi:3alpha(or 20beta)-hydroxysteroid dehydrogenase